MRVTYVTYVTYITYVTYVTYVTYATYATYATYVTYATYNVILLYERLTRNSDERLNFPVSDLKNSKKFSTHHQLIFR